MAARWRVSEGSVQAVARRSRQPGVRPRMSNQAIERLIGRIGRRKDLRRARSSHRAGRPGGDAMTLADDLRGIVRVDYRDDLGLIGNEFHIDELSQAIPPAYSKIHRLVVA
jgi:hypothetical protein